MQYALFAAYMALSRLCHRDALRGTSLFGPLVTRFDRFADDDIKYIHEERCSMDGLRQENRRTEFPRWIARWQNRSTTITLRQA